MIDRVDIIIVFISIVKKKTVLSVEEVVCCYLLLIVMMTTKNCFLLQVFKQTIENKSRAKNERTIGDTKQKFFYFSILLS